MKEKTTTYKLNEKEIAKSGSARHNWERKNSSAVKKNSTQELGGSEN